MKLDNAQCEAYQRDGFLCPLIGPSADATTAILAELEAFEQQAGDTLGKLPGQLRAKSHLLFPWAQRLIRQTTILDAVESLIGPDILVYHVTCWLKEPNDPSFVPWHQDATYFHLQPFEHLTAWVALTPSQLDSGCLIVVPGSQTAGQRQHDTAPAEANLLSNGQFVAEKIDEQTAVALTLQPGEFSLHHTHLIHRSGPNKAPYRRIGIGISYIPTRVRFTGHGRLSATLVRGEDRFGHFDPEPAPVANLDQAAVSFHQQACQRFFNNHGSSRTATIAQSHDHK